MRNPNGYGTVVKLSGNRRRPYVVRKTVRIKENGHALLQNIGYYATRREGLMALAEYNRNPWDVDGSKVTLEDLYQMWLCMKTKKMHAKSVTYLKSAYNHTTKLQKIKYRDIKSYHIQEVIDECGRGASMQAHIKTLFYHLDNFALETDVIFKGYSSLVRTETPIQRRKTPFTPEEIQILWQHKHEPYFDIILIFLYTGFRASELLEMRTENVNLEDATFTGGTKTKAGRDRIVPIHPRILDLVKNRYQENSKFFLTEQGEPIPYHRLYRRFQKAMQGVNMIHNIHECRHTFRSLLDSANANSVCMDLLMGHKSLSVGDRVYTHKTIQELRDTILLITN